MYLYARKHPKPNRPPQLITAKWDDVKREETHTSFKHHSFEDQEPPVVYLDSDAEYHMGMRALKGRQGVEKVSIKICKKRGKKLAISVIS